MPIDIRSITTPYLCLHYCISFLYLLLDHQVNRSINSDTISKILQSVNMDVIVMSLLYMDRLEHLLDIIIYRSASHCPSA